MWTADGWNPTLPSPSGRSRFLIEYYEVDRDRYEEVCRSWDNDLPGMLWNKERIEVATAEEVRDTLRRWLDDLTALKDPSLVGTPEW
jgi:hypothetical protein